MRKNPISVVAPIALVIGLLSVLPTAAHAQTQQAAAQSKQAIAAAKRKHYYHQYYNDLYGSAPNLPGCTWPFQNKYPPCMSTFPQGDPNYHGGSHPGPD